MARGGWRRATAVTSALLLGAALVGTVGTGTVGAAVGRIEVASSADPLLNGAEGLASAPDGSLYVAAYSSDTLTRFEPLTGARTTIADDADAETDIDGPSRLVVDQSTGEVWYTNYANGSIGRYDPDTGETESFTAPALAAPWGIVLDADGDAWFADYSADAIGVVDATSGAITVLTDPLFDGPNELAFGSDGRLWFTNYDGDEVGVVDLDTEEVTTYTAAGIDAPWAITPVGDDLWFTSHLGGKVGRITSTGTITLFGGPATNGRPVGIDPGPDGTLWFSFRSSPELANGGIGRITVATGKVRAYPLADPALTGGVSDVEAAAGPGADGADETWFYATDFFIDALVRIEAGEQVFTDVGVDHPFFDEIGFVEDEGIATGYDPGPTYRSGAPVTRQAMSAFMYRLAGEPPFTDPTTPTFTDVGLAHPFFTEIEWMAAEEVSTGYQPGPTYRPGAPVTRQAMSAFLYRLAGEPAFTAPPNPSFTDVGLTHPFFTEIEWMADEGVTTGYDDGTYRPGATVSRGAMAAFLFRVEPLIPA